MRRFTTLLVTALALVAMAMPAAAEKLAYDGSFILQFVNFGRAKASATGTGIATVNGSAGLGHLTTLQVNEPSGVLNTVLPVTDPIVTAGGVVALRLTNVVVRPDLQGGTFRPISGAVQSTGSLTQNTMVLTGAVRVCLYDPGCSGGLDLNLGQTVNGVFIGGGVGGVLTIGGAGGIRISILGAPWTVKTVSLSNRVEVGTITTFTRQGFAHGPASGTSSTALTSGVIQLVSANQTRTVGIPGNTDAQGQIETYRLHFIPEPGLLLLLGAGALGLGLLGRKRMR